jgi:Glycosyl transferases group 1
LLRGGVCENVNGTAEGCSALLVYITEPFFTREVDVSHQSRWQVKELARIIGQFGYDVDVIDHQNNDAKLTRDYDLVVDIHPGLNRTYYSHMSHHCKRIGYITGTNPAVANRAEYERLEDLCRRKGARLAPRRQAQPFTYEELHGCDAIFFIGSQYNFASYAEFGLRDVFFIKNTGHEFLSPAGFLNKDSHSFLFLGGGGQVHKGLDLLLDVFVSRPHLKLYVCSPFEHENDFHTLYRRELTAHSNIIAVGFVDILSPQFRNICDTCAFMLYPSCAEGIAGSVLTAMSAGVIPVVSKESGFGDDEVFLLSNCKVETLAEVAEEFAKKDSSWIVSQAEKTVRVVAERYSAQNYSESVRSGLAAVLGRIR